MLTKFNLYQPAAIDNSLNSYQMIHKIIHEINLIIDEVNNIDTKANEYTDEQIRLLKAELQIRFNDVETLISGLSDRIDVTESQIQGIFAELTSLRNIMNSNFTQIYNRIEEVNTSLTLQIQDNYIALYHYIDSQIEMIKQLINSISENKVFNIYGKKSTLQNALDDIYKIMNPHTDITINQLLTIIDNGVTYWGANTKLFKDITINSILNCEIQTQVYFGGDFTTSNYYFCKLILRTSFNNLIKTPFYNFLYLLIQSAIYQWTSEAQSQTPTMITNIWRYFYTSFGYPTYNNAIYLNSTYSDYNNDTPI